MARPDPPSPAFVAVGFGALLLIFAVNQLAGERPTDIQLLVVAGLVAGVGLGLVWLRDRRR